MCTVPDDILPHSTLPKSTIEFSFRIDTLGPECKSHINEVHNTYTCISWYYLECNNMFDMS